MSKAKNPTDKQVSGQSNSGKGTRETLESIVIAIILAFLFRAFEAEAFVIPTGSMAPTLQGQHVDSECPKCHYWYRTGASEHRGGVYATTCPICRYTNQLNESDDNTFSGDRILVSKFAYDLPGSEPQRWDVIVFKFPGNAKVNYIKRLIGLPGEKIRIWQGNIYVKRREDADFRVARKTEHSAAKLKAMLQLVDDTDFIPEELVEAGWPSRWEASPGSSEGAWTHGAVGHVFQTDGKHGKTMLRYRHVIPSDTVWRGVEGWNSIGKIADIDGEQAAAVQDMLRLGGLHTMRNVVEMIEGFDANQNGVFDLEEKQAVLRKLVEPSLIEDFYAYNASNHADSGHNWVGDLAIESDFEVKGDKGYVLLNLVRGGIDYDCRIDVATGEAVLSIDDGRGEFIAADGTTAAQSVAKNCGVQGAGRYQVRFANVDNELVLWINDQRVEFDSPTTYRDRGEVHEVLSEESGDLAPVGVGSDGVAVEFTRLKVLRDVYYIADASFYPGGPGHRDRRDGVELPCPEGPNADGYLGQHGVAGYQGDDQYLPLGDNSPQSMDSRLWREDPGSRAWTIPTSVSRRMLLGKALFIYWPHPWHGFVPNFARMGFIR